MHLTGTLRGGPLPLRLSASGKKRTEISTLCVLNRTKYIIKQTISYWKEQPLPVIVITLNDGC